MKAGVMGLNEAEFIQRALNIKRKLYCVAYSILWNDADCADAMQEAAAKAWMSRNRLEYEEFFETWLVRILINECRTLLRKRRRSETASFADPAATELSLAADMDFRAALMRMKAKYRLPLILHCQDGYTLSEIADILGIGEGLVKSRLHQARKELKRLLGGDGNEI